MKKIILGCVAFLFASSAIAQDECLNFFPEDVGTMLINNTYDANDRLLGTAIYKVNQYVNTGNQPNLDVTLTMTDAMNNVIDRGNITASCENGVFRMRMTNAAVSKAMLDRMANHTGMISNFMDFPNAYRNNALINTIPVTDDIEFTLGSHENNEDNLNVRIYNRQYKDAETVTTPAGDFNAAKTSFNFDVTRDGETATYKGVDWYTVGMGIVRSETYDTNDNLINYTILTTIRDSESSAVNM